MTDIIQSDRDFAAKIEPSGRERDQILRGKRNASKEVETFAAYRRSLIEPTPERVERVARALYQDWVNEHIGLAEFSGWDQLADKDTWRGRARAAIAAMGEAS
jgi:hypothetical protein